MAVKVGNSWVSETALTYAKAKADSGAAVTLKGLSERFPGVNFSTSTQPFSQKGTNNIQIAPNILAQMQNDPEKRVEYEALIYDCAKLISDGKMDQAMSGSRVKAAGTIINSDGSVGGWTVTESSDGSQTRSRTKLDKDKKDKWAEKLREMQKERRAEEKKEEEIRVEKRLSEYTTTTYTDKLTQSQEGQESYEQLSSVSYRA